MKKKLLFPTAFLLALGTSCSGSGDRNKTEIEDYLNASQNMPLEEGFFNPPRIARPMAWTWWMNGLVNKEGLTKDLENYARNGMGGFGMFDKSWDANPMHDSPFMSEKWLDNFHYMVKECDRLGLECGFHNCAGHAESGGPWITPEMSMKSTVWTRSDVTSKGGNTPVELPPLAHYKGYSEDAFIVAFPKVDEIPAFYRHMKDVKSSGVFDDTFLMDGCPFSYTAIKKTGKSESAHFDFTFDKNVTFNSFYISFRRWESKKDPARNVEWGDNSEVEILVQAMKDGKFRTVKSYKLKKRPIGIDPVKFGFEKTTASKFRILFRFKKGSNLLIVPEMALLGAGEKPLWSPELHGLSSKIMVGRSGLGDYKDSEKDSPKKIVKSGDVRVFAPLKDGKGNLNLPKGEWTVLRFGCTSTGMMNDPATFKSGKGLESDKFSAEATQLHFDSFPRIVLEQNKEYLAKTLKHIEIDSWECRFQNWTQKLPEYFKADHSYGIEKYMPSFAGYTIDSPDVTNRFLFDFRRTCSDLVTKNYFKKMDELCSEYGVYLLVEGLYNWKNLQPSDILKNWGNSAAVMDEFWYDALPKMRKQSVWKSTASDALSAANAYNKRVVTAESFTSTRENMYWRMSPMEIKDVGDKAFADGINRYFLHCSAHQSDDYWPGSYGGEGMKFNRNNPWFTMSKGFMDNIARTQFLLQRGAFYGDVLNFAGTSVPTDIDLDKSLSTPDGYRNLTINSDALIQFADVEDGRIVLPIGSSFAVMTLPNTDRMDIESLKKIEELVRKGATIAGCKPTREKSLENYPACDGQVKKLADKIWQGCDGVNVKKVKYGKGNVYWNVPMEEILSDLKVLPDFEYKVNSDKRMVLFHHRTDPASGSEIYFVSNCENRPVDALLTLGKPKKHAEIWHTEFGEIFPCKYDLLKDGRAEVSLRLSPRESMFIVFRDEKSANYSSSANLNRQALESLGEIAGTWKISFACDPKNIKVPEPFTSDRLFRLNESDDPELKYFSGYITYENEFDFDAKALPSAGRVVLDLGEVNMLADLYLNGEKVANLWRVPFALDVTQYLKDGKNSIKIVVVNHLDNKIIGDLKLPREERVLKMTVESMLTNYKFRNHEPMPSGLVGPVELKIGKTGMVR